MPDKIPERLDDLRALFERLDERSKNNHDLLIDLKETVKSQNKDIHDTLEKNYITKNEFDPIRKIVFGFVGFMLLSFGGLAFAVIVKANSYPAEAYVAAKSTVKSATMPSATNPPNVIIDLNQHAH